MIGYVTLGVRDLKAATPLYEAIAQELGVPRFMETDRSIAWGYANGPAGLGITLPFDGRPASWGNGAMVALNAASPEQVQRIYEIALAYGATDEGAPGPRGGGFCAAYFRDMDGNKLNAFCITSDPS
jgi:predicted lactoylglutathione lyase